MEKKYSKANRCLESFRTLRQTVSWDTPMSMATVPQRNTISSDIANENNRCSNISDESVTAPPAPISSSSSEQDNHEANAWSSDYSNSEDEFPNLEDSVAPVSCPAAAFICQLKYVYKFNQQNSFIFSYFFIVFN